MHKFSGELRHLALAPQGTESTACSPIVTLCRTVCVIIRARSSPTRCSSSPWGDDARVQTLTNARPAFICDTVPSLLAILRIAIPRHKMRFSDTALERAYAQDTREHRAKFDWKYLGFETVLWGLGVSTH